MPTRKTTARTTGMAAKLQTSIVQQAKPSTTAHLIIIARAGTGKTTTMIEGLKRIKGLETRITPSPQQQAVWDAMCETPATASIAIVAFNKAIATELQTKVPNGVNASTMHSMGMSAIKCAFSSVRVNEYRVADILSEVAGKDIRELRKHQPTLVKAVCELVGLCKANLIGTETEDNRGDWLDAEGMSGALAELCSYYDVETNGSQEEIFRLVPKVLERCKDVAKDGCIDFDDMIWLPVALGLPVYRYDLLMVDEAQDLNRCQQALAKKASKRLILCGDPCQAIYGFAGADSESMARMQRELEATELGCQVLPLTVTRRCGHAIVAEAKKLVPDFEAFATNSVGNISRGNFQGPEANAVKETMCYRASVEDGDMVLCRVTAPLISQCFKFLKAGRKANIRGRDIGRGLISTINKLKCDTVPDLLFKLSDWLHTEVTKENAKRNPNEGRLINLQDRYDCLCCFCEGKATVVEVIDSIDDIFTDIKGGTGISLSSIHKAKGLEAKRVFLLQPKGGTVPHPIAKTKWQKEQESNLLYVAITRAIEELVYVAE